MSDTPSNDPREPEPEALEAEALELLRRAYYLYGDAGRDADRDRMNAALLILEPRDV